MMREFLGLYLKDRIAAKDASRDDIAEIVDWLQDPTSQIPHNSLMDGFATLLTSELATAIDRLPIAYGLLSEEERMKTIEASDFSSPSMVDAFTALVRKYDYHRVTADTQEFLSRYHAVDPLIVQVPIEPERATKQRIRADLAKIAPNGFAVFQIERPLLGGIRVFAGGKLYDKSWLSEVKRLLSA